MPVNKDAMARYRIIDRMLADPSRDYTTKEIHRAVRKECERDVTIRMIQKDIHALEDQDGPFRKKMVRNAGGKGTVRYEDQSEPLFYKELTGDEEEVLREVLKTLGQFEGLDNFSWFDLLKKKLSMKGEGVQRPLISFGRNDVLQIEGNLLGRLFTAISRKKVIRFRYKPFNTDDAPALEPTVHPYQLKQYNNRWYLLCTPIGTEKYPFDPEFIANYALDRFVGDFEYVDDIGFRDTPVDLEARYSEIMGVTLKKDEVCEDIYFAVKPEFVKYVETKWMHGNQLPLDSDSEDDFRKRYPGLADNRFFSIECRPNPELINRFASYAGLVTLVEPARLRDAVKERINQAARDMGILEGKAEGLAEGEAKGRAEGKAEGKAETALAMLSNGLDIALISKCTGLSEQQIEKMQKP